jgi:outer membrane receptor for ferrienterochelin and colicins
MNSLFANGLKINIGATFIDSRVITNNTTEYPYLTEKFSGNYKISYTLYKPKITFDISGTIIGSMKLPLLSDLDTRDPISDIINIINLQTSYTFKGIELYTGIKNILDFKPPSDSIARAFDPFDSNVVFGANGQIIATPNNPEALSFDPTYVFYSNQGINGFFGMRYNF